MTQLGKFISFEGGEGAGKSTQAELLCRALRNQGITVIHTREPGGTPEAEAIRELLVQGEAERWDSVTETLLHIAARRQHTRSVIEPALLAGNWVVCDRFIHSTIAYQGYGNQLGQDWLEMLHYLTIGRLWPCATFVFDLPVEEGLKRASARQETNRYETLDTAFHERVRAGFKAVAAADPTRCITVNAMLPLSTIHQQVIDAVNQRFGVELQQVQLPILP